MEKLENNSLEIVSYLYIKIFHYPKMEEKINFVKEYILSLPFRMKHYDTSYERIQESFFLNKLLESEPICEVFSKFHILEEVLELTNMDELVRNVLRKNPQLEISISSLKEKLNDLVEIQCTFNLFYLISQTEDISFNSTSLFLNQKNLPIYEILGIHAYYKQPFQGNFLDEYFDIYDNMCKAKMDYQEDLTNSLNGVLEIDKLDFLKRMKEYIKNLKHVPWVGFIYYHIYFNQINSLIKKIQGKARKKEKKEDSFELLPFLK